MTPTAEHIAAAMPEIWSLWAAGPSDEVWGTAVHEAAHAAAAHALRLRFGRLVVCQRPTNGALGQVVFLPQYGRRDPVRGVRDAVATAAPMVLESWLQGWANAADHHDPRLDEVQGQHPLCSYFADLQNIHSSHGPLTQELIDMTSSLVLVIYPAIFALADELYRRRRMSGREAGRIIRRAACWWGAAQRQQRQRMYRRMRAYLGQGGVHG